MSSPPSIAFLFPDISSSYVLIVLKMNYGKLNLNSLLVVLKLCVKRNTCVSSVTVRGAPGGVLGALTTWVRIKLFSQECCPKTVLLWLLKGHPASKHLGPSVPLLPTLSKVVSHFPALSQVKKDPCALQKIQARLGFLLLFLPSCSTQMKVIDVKLFSPSAFFCLYFLDLCNI